MSFRVKYIRILGACKQRVGGRYSPCRRTVEQLVRATLAIDGDAHVGEGQDDGAAGVLVPTMIVKRAPGGGLKLATRAWNWLCPYIRPSSPLAADRYARQRHYVRQRHYFSDVRYGLESLS